jgi:hypothetical protein
VFVGFEEPMAIIWTVSHPERLVVAVGRNEVTATDILFCVDGMLKAGVISYRKIYDMTLLGITMPRLDLRSVGMRMAAMADSRGFGPVAIVVSSNGVAGSARHFEETSAARRPVQIFRSLYAARAWLDEIMPPDQVPEVAHEHLGASQSAAVVESRSSATLTVKSALSPILSKVLGLEK